MNKILAIIFYIGTLNAAFAEFAVLKAFPDGIALMFPGKNLIKVIPVPNIKKKSIQLLNLEQNILTAKEMAYGGSRTWYDRLLFVDLKKHRISKFDPYKFELPGYSAEDAYHVKDDEWAVMLWKLPELTEYWILFDIEKQKIIDKNYHAEENFITYKKSDDLKKWENSWFFRKVITERFDNAKESVKNGSIVFSRYKNYLLVSDFKKMFLFNAGPNVAEKDERFLYDLSDYLQVIDYDKSRSEFTRFIASEDLSSAEFDWHGCHVRLKKNGDGAFDKDIAAKCIADILKKTLSPDIAEGAITSGVKINGSMISFAKQSGAFEIKISFERTGDDVMALRNFDIHIVRK